jgi:hypothetical protein
MTSEQQAAYVHAQSVCMLAEIMGMQAENLRAQKGLISVVPYGKADFDDVITRYGIHHNGCITLFHGY